MNKAGVLSTTLVLLLVLLGVADAGKPILGGNVGGNDYYSINMVWQNMIHQAGVPFGTSSAPWSPSSSPLNANRFPVDDFGIIITTNQLPGQLYDNFTLTVVGAGPNLAINLVASPGFSISTPFYDSSTNTWIAILSSQSYSNQLMLGFVKQSGQISSISVLRSGASKKGANPTFTTVYLDLIQRYGVLRFMDMRSTNSAPSEQDWNTRCIPSTPNCALPDPTPWELIIELCNAVNADPWLNIPTNATDDYVNQLAKLLLSKLNPNLNIYIEWSNEVWNSEFPQFNTNIQDAIYEVEHYNTHLNATGGNKWEWAWRRTGERIVNISKIFSSVFGPSSINSRIRCILAAQQVYFATFQEPLSYIQQFMGPPSQFLYAISGAPYFNMGKWNSYNNLTVEEVLHALEVSVETAYTDFKYEELQTLATWYGLKFHAYEAGPDTFGPNSVEAKMNASLDGRIKKICLKYLNDFYAAGFVSMNWYTGDASDYDSQFGTWGVTNNVMYQTSPKIQAIDEFLAAPTPIVTIGQIIPGYVDARNHSIPKADFSTPDLTDFPSGATFDFLVNGPAGMYNMDYVGVYTPSGGSSYYLETWVNGELVKNDSVGAGGMRKTETVVVLTGKQLNVVRVTVVCPQQPKGWLGVSIQGMKFTLQSLDEGMLLEDSVVQLISGNEETLL